MDIHIKPSPSSLVLVVDDKEIMRYQLRHTLEKAGYRVIEAHDGVQGLTAYMESKPDIVLLDALMPAMNGFTCCSQIQLLPEEHHAPVLMITGLEDDESVNQAFEVGAADYITKPIQRAVLLQRVKRLINQSQLYQNLQKTAAKYQSLYNKTPVMLHTIDEQRVLIRVSQYWLDYLGYEPHEVVGKQISEILTPPSQRYMATFNSPGFSDIGFARDLPFQVIKKNGEVIDVLLSAIAELDEEGKTTHSLCVMTDITERVQYEQDLIELNAELQQQSIKLEAVNKELESFSYSVSHDLRSPLRIVDGFSLALLEDYGDCLNEEGKSYLQQIRTSTQRMAELIDDLLQLSRLNRVEMHQEHINLSSMVTAIAQTLKLQDPNRDCQFAIADQVFATGDPQLLRIALENLLGNAWKFTGKQSQARIEFGITQHERYADQLVYFIKDNGAGFNMSYANKLFGAFQRLHKTEEFPGTGIGLATVQRVINRHGGKIWAESVVSEGATFYFTL